MKGGPLRQGYTVALYLFYFSLLILGHSCKGKLEYQRHLFQRQGTINIQFN